MQKTLLLLKRRHQKYAPEEEELQLLFIIKFIQDKVNLNLKLKVTLFTDMEENVSMEILQHMCPQNYQYKIMTDMSNSNVLTFKDEFRNLSVGPKLDPRIDPS